MRDEGKRFFTSFIPSLCSGWLFRLSVTRVAWLAVGASAHATFGWRGVWGHSVSN